jgi:hypothetical protein
MDEDRLTTDLWMASPSPRGALRVEVRQGDKVGGWSGERAEVANMLDGSGAPIQEVPGDALRYYAFGMRPDVGWRPPILDENGYVWGIMLQLHGPDDLGVPPAFALYAEDHFGVALNGGNIDVERNVVRHRLPARLIPGQWTLFIIAVRWANDNRGFVTVWQSDSASRDFAELLNVRDIATLQYSGDEPVRPHYWKFGYYRSGSPFVSRLWLTPLVRAHSFEEARTSAFQTD